MTTGRGNFVHILTPEIFFWQATVGEGWPSFWDLEFRREDDGPSLYLSPAARLSKMKSKRLEM